MASNIVISQLLKTRNLKSITRSFSSGKIIFNKQCPPESGAIPEVKGLSSACVNVPQEPVGPGASKDGCYKVPEYFCYDKNSYFEAEVEMQSFRCPQPSSKVPYFQDAKK